MINQAIVYDDKRITTLTDCNGFPGTFLKCIMNILGFHILVLQSSRLIDRSVCLYCTNCITLCVAPDVLNEYFSFRSVVLIIYYGILS